MIVVCGKLDARGSTASLAVSIAERAAASVDRPGTVQFVGVVPDTADGDRSVQALVTAGVGHAAVMRGADRALEAGDVDLAVRYLPDVHVTVGVDLSAEATAALTAAAGFAGAASIVVTGAASVDAGRDVGAASPTFALEAPANDPDGTFAGFVALLAVRLDAGDEPAVAWHATIRDLAVDAV